MMQNLFCLAKEMVHMFLENGINIIVFLNNVIKLTSFNVFKVMFLIYFFK